MTLVLSVLEQGMIYAIMALGIYITYTILDFPDLTVDGSFPLGAALSAVLITNGVNPILTLLVTFAAGAFAGMLTGIIHVKLKVRDLLSGIIMMTALYTVNRYIYGCGQGHHKNHRPCNRQRPLQLKRMHFCTAAEIFRHINGNRNNGYRTGERYYRNQPA